MEPPSPFVPDGFEPPHGLVAPEFVLEPLGPQHNEADYAAWMSSIAHIRGTPGFEESSWPHEMSLAENLRDLERHTRDFRQRSGFTYTVLDPDERDVIGCVYIYPVAAADDERASARSWVRADRGELDKRLWHAVSEWLRRDWPFESVRYAARS